MIVSNFYQKSVGRLISTVTNLSFDFLLSKIQYRYT